jgi:CRISPR-associated protein Cas6/Cse3/CasE subtype I-E
VSRVGEAGVRARLIPAPLTAAGDPTPDDDPHAIGEHRAMPRDLWLSRVELAPGPDTHTTLAHDASTRHRIILRAFPGVASRQQAGALHHYTAATAGRPPRLLVQSIAMPDWSLLGAYAAAQVTNIGPFWDQVADGERYRFRLTAAPTRAARINPGECRRGIRTPITDRERQILWLTRLLEGAATLINVDVTTPTTTTGRRAGRTVTVISVTFAGVLIVTDRHRLRQHAIAGIGAHKNLGHGLLAIAKEQR